MFAPLVPSTSILFVSESSISSGNIASYGLKKRIEAVKNCRNIGKKDMKFNDAMPKMKVDPENYRVEADGVHMTCEAADSLPLSQASYVYWEHRLAVLRFAKVMVMQFLVSVCSKVAHYSTISLCKYRHNLLLRRLFKECVRWSFQIRGFCSLYLRFQICYVLETGTKSGISLCSTCARDMRLVFNSRAVSTPPNWFFCGWVGNVCAENMEIWARLYSHTVLAGHFYGVSLSVALSSYITSLCSVFRVGLPRICTPQDLGNTWAPFRKQWQITHRSIDLWSRLFPWVSIISKNGLSADDILVSPIPLNLVTDSLRPVIRFRHSQPDPFSPFSQWGIRTI